MKVKKDGKMRMVMIKRRSRDRRRGKKGEKKEHDKE